MKIKRKSYYFFGFLLVVLLGYTYLFQEHRKIDEESPEFILSSELIHQEFDKTLKSAEFRYLDKTIVVKGRITELNSTDLTLDDKIYCKFNEGISFVLGQAVAIQGRCIGFDELLEQVKLDQCSPIGL